MSIEETWLLQYIEKAKRFGATVALDIGANVGEWTAVLAEHFDTVVAVEPDPRAFAELSKLASSKVVVVNAAVTSKMGAVDFHLRHNTVQSSLLLEHPIGAGDQEEAPVVETIGVNGMTLDFLVSSIATCDGPLFVKVDVEGAEGDVLAGATLDCFKKAAWLIEIHDREREVGLGLASLGYDGLSVTPHPLEGAHPKHKWIYTEPGYEHS
jgi:FkbM family methyltransferase